MKVVDIENIKIVSINEKFGYNPKTGRHYINKGYEDFKNAIIFNCAKCKIEPPYKIGIEVDTYTDIDNCVKAVLDALQTAGAIDNDKDVLELHVVKTPIPKNMLGNLSIDIEHKGGLT